MDLLINIVITSLACCGLYLITEPNYIGFPIRQLLKKLPDLIYSPLLGCITCMGSVYGFLGWFALGGSIIELPFFMFCVAFLNTFIYRLMDRI